MEGTAQIDDRDAVGNAHAPEPSPRSFWERPLADWTLLLIVAAVTLPILWMGYGTDIDVANVLEAGEEIRSGSYEPSRTPGVPVVETIVAVLDPVGGHLLVNLATAIAAGALIVGIARLVRTWGHANGDLVALAFLASPVTIIASTSLADFIWALMFFVWGALVFLGEPAEPEPAQPEPAEPAPKDRLAVLPTLGGRLGSRRSLEARTRIVLAGVLFALAIGSRLSTGFVIAALLVADGWDPARRRRCVLTALVAAPLGAALYIPSWLAFDRSLGFLETADGYRGFFSNVGLFLYKGYAATGIALIVVLALTLPALWRTLAAWGRDPMLRFSVLTLLVTLGLFLQLPWKLAHLLPSLLAALLWLAASSWGRNRRFLWIVIAALAVNGVVTFRPLAPNDADEATTGTWNPAISPGLLVNDIDCRWEYMQRAPSQQAIKEAWACTLIPLRGDIPPE